MGERGWGEPASPKISSGKARKYGSFAGYFYFCPEWVGIGGHFHTEPPTITTIFLGAAASAQTSRILHTSLGPAGPAPPQELLTLSSAGSRLFTSEWLPCSAALLHSPPSTPHSALPPPGPLLARLRPPSVSPQGCPRFSPTTRPGRKNEARRSARVPLRGSQSLQPQQVPLP